MKQIDKTTLEVIIVFFIFFGLLAVAFAIARPEKLRMEEEFAIGKEQLKADIHEYFKWDASVCIEALNNSRVYHYTNGDTHTYIFCFPASDTNPMFPKLEYTKIGEEMVLCDQGYIKLYELGDS